jgi:uncharacterized protein (DUF488 family)
VHALSTIGYESDTLDGVIGRLKSAGVSLLIDVRAVASSRRPGFSKTMLAASLAEAGIDYLHLRPLGTPKAGRDAARAGRTAEMQALFRDHLAEPSAVAALAEAILQAQARPSALLCYEAEACRCHRAIVAEAIRSVLRCDVLDL